MINKIRAALLGIVFLYTIQLTFTAYSDSTFLSTFLGENNVGWIYAIQAIITILGYLLLPRIQKGFGNYATIMMLIAIKMAGLVGLALGTSNLAIIISFILMESTLWLIFLCLDIFLEHSSTDKLTGRIRGLWLLSLNFAYLLGPIIGSIFISYTGNFSMMYIIRALLLIPLMVIITAYFRRFSDPQYHTLRLITNIKRFIEQPNLYRIFYSNTVLQIFFAVMVIYTPIFLNVHIGLPWSQIGIIIGIAILPFVILDAPLGYMSDLLTGEKEILIIGALITGITSIFIPFAQIGSWIGWAILLFITRIGASAMEVMNETYFFKQINDKDVGVISLYRMIFPFSYLVAATFSSTFLVFGDMKWLFIVIGILVLSAIMPLAKLKDTR